MNSLPPRFPVMTEETLTAVGRYHMVTTKHLIDGLGVSTNPQALRRAIRTKLTGGTRPLLNRISYTDDRRSIGRVRRHDLFTLTRNGARVLEDMHDLPAGSLPCFSEARKIDFDYAHRVATIEALMAIDTNTKERDPSKRWEHLPYYAPKGSLDSRERAYEYPDGTRVIPDAMSALRGDTGDIEAMVALELHNSHKPNRIAEQLIRLLKLSLDGQAADRWGCRLPLLIVSISMEERTMEAVQEQVQKMPGYDRFADRMRFGTLETLKENCLADGHGQLATLF